VHVLKSGCRWCDCPPEYGPVEEPRTNRFPCRQHQRRLDVISGDSRGRNGGTACRPSGPRAHCVWATGTAL
jgi:hypothetical protein